MKTLLTPLSLLTHSALLTLVHLTTRVLSKGAATVPDAFENYNAYVSLVQHVNACIDIVCLCVHKRVCMLCGMHACTQTCVRVVK